MNQLVIFEPKTSIEVLFTPAGVDEFFHELEKYARDFKGDVSTEEGRAEIRSFAHKLAKAKNELDRQGKTLTDDWTAKTKLVNLERSKLWDKMEHLQKQVRQPLDDFENIEKLRVQEREDRLKEIINLADAGINDTVESAETKLNKIKELKEFDWQEFKFKAHEESEKSINFFEIRLEKIKKYNAEQKELAELREQKALQEQKDREEKVAKEAADNAKKEAEEKAAEDAKKESQRVEHEKKLEAEKLAAVEAEKERAKKAEAKAKQDKADAEIKAAEDKKAALKKAEDDKQNAIEAERKRAADEKEAERLAQEKREANKKHRSKINNAALASFIENGVGDITAKKVIELIAKGLISNITINY